MKKLFICFAVVAFAMMGCAKVDYGCTWDFVVVNNTDLNVTIMWNGGRGDVILPNEELTIYSSKGLCGKQKDDLGDLYPQGEMVMQLSHSSNTIIQMKVGDEVLPEIVVKRKYWDFVATGNYSAIYTLTIADELIENLKNQ